MCTADLNKSEWSFHRCYREVSVQCGYVCAVCRKSGWINQHFSSIKKEAVETLLLHPQPFLRPWYMGRPPVFTGAMEMASACAHRHTLFQGWALALATPGPKWSPTISRITFIIAVRQQPSCGLLLPQLIWLSLQLRILIRHPSPHL